jgi:hypothetical protein
VEPRQNPAGERVPRIARLMALAIVFDRMLREGKVKDLTELARLAHVSQPRMTQIMNLNHLAPEIQERLLYMHADAVERRFLRERDVRPVAFRNNWMHQRDLWRSLRRGPRVARVGEA